jgi:IS30 family transposase
MVLNFADVSKERKKATPEEIATMRDMLTKGFYIKAIAEKVGRSYKSTYEYCSSIKAELQSPRPTLEPSTTSTKHPNTRKPWTRAEIDRLLSLHAAGLKIDAVARELGRPTGAVRQKYRSHLPYRHQPSQFVTEGSGSDSATTQRPRIRKAWSAEDDKHLVELVANGKGFERIGKDLELIGKDFERIASVLGRTATAVKNRWYQVVRPRLDYEREIGNLSDASGTQKQDQQMVHDLSHIDPQSRRNFTTLHGREPRLAINLQKQSSALTHSSHRVIGAAPWKRRGVFSLPYRPQRRFAHTESSPSSQTKRKQNRRPFSEEETCKIVELHATQLPWIKIAEIMGRARFTVCSHARRSLQQQRWREKFEQVRAAVPDDQKYYGARKDMKRRQVRRDAYTTEEHEKIVDLRAKGCSYNDIGEALGRSDWSVRRTATILLKDERWMRRYEAVMSTVPDVDRNRHYKGSLRYTHEEDATISKMRKAGFEFKLMPLDVTNPLSRRAGDYTSTRPALWQHIDQVGRPSVQSGTESPPTRTSS